MFQQTYLALCEFFFFYLQSRSDLNGYYVYRKCVKLEMYLILHSVSLTELLCTSSIFCGLIAFHRKYFKHLYIIVKDMNKIPSTDWSKVPRVLDQINVLANGSLCFLYKCYLMSCALQQF